MFKAKRRRSQRSSGSSISRQVAPNLAEGSPSTTILKGCLKNDAGVTDQQSGRWAGDNSAKCDSQATDLTKSTGGSKRVVFKNVYIREPERVLGDNPSCSSGAPISIGWAYVKDQSVRLDDYEEEKSRRRGQLSLVLTRQDREELLLEWGATFPEIIDAIRANVKIKNQRRSTVNAIGRYDKMEEMMESAARRIKRTILLQKPTHKKVEELTSKVGHVQPANAPLLMADRSPSLPGRASSPTPSQVSVDDDDESTIHLPDSPSMSRNSLSQLIKETNPIKKPGPIDLDAVSVTDADESLPVPIMEVDIAEQQSVPSYYSIADDASQATLGDRGMYGLSSQNELSQNAMSQLTSSHSNFPYDASEATYPQDQDTESAYSNETDGFGALQRDSRHWEVTGVDAPQIQRRIMPTVICEDGYMGHTHEDNAMLLYAAEDQYQHRYWEVQGFAVQPPPYSNSIISRWE